MDLFALLIFMAFVVFVFWFMYSIGYYSALDDIKKAKVKFILLEFENGEREWCRESELKDFKASIKYTVIKTVDFNK